MNTRSVLDVLEEREREGDVLYVSQISVECMQFHHGQIPGNYYYRNDCADERCIWGHSLAGCLEYVLEDVEPTADRLWKTCRMTASNTGLITLTSISSRREPL